MLYMVTFTINIPQMLAYIPYMDPMGYVVASFFSHEFPTLLQLHMRCPRTETLLMCVCVFQVFFDSRQILPARNQVRTVPGATSDILIRVSIQTLQILRSMQVLASAFQECSKRNNIWSAGLKGT